jgi:biotin carboxylase
MRKLLLVGGSHADIPVIKAARRKGFHVITTGNNPKDLGHAFSDEYIPEDYSRPEKILELARKLRIDAICYSANDFSAISCSYVAQKLNLPGFDPYETALTLHHKDRFRTFAQNIGINVPVAVKLHRHEAFSQLDPRLRYPLIIKPVDLSGGKGISRVDSEEELESACQKAFQASRRDTIVIEEFIDGSNHGYSTVIKKGKVVFSFMDDEYYFINPYLVAGASTSANYRSALANQLNKAIETMAKRLSLVDGIFHVQFILKNDIPYIIEVCRRTPGDLYVKLVEYSTGYDMARSIIDSVTGSILDECYNDRISYITRHCVMGEKQGYIGGIEYGELEEKIFDRFTFYQEGSYIEDPLTYKAEIDFIQYETREEMIDYSRRLTEIIRLRYQE